MDEETRLALELTRDELVAIREAGTPVAVAKRPPGPSMGIHIGSIAAVRVDPVRPTAVVRADVTAVTIG